MTGTKPYLFSWSSSFLLLLCCAVFRLSGQEVYQVNPDYPVQPLMEHLDILVDEEGKLSWEEVHQKPAGDFVKRAELGENLEISTVYWGKVLLHSDREIQGWELHLEDPLMNSIFWDRSNGNVDVFKVVDGELQRHSKTGVDYPASEREIPEPWNINRVRLDLEAGETATFIIRVTSNSFGYWPYFNLSLRHPSYADYFPVNPSNIVFLWFVLGISFITLLYHFLMWVYTRERIFLWFSLWLLFCTLTQVMTVGLDTKFLLGEYPQWRFTVWLLIPNSMLYTFWFFGRAFIKSKEKFPLLDKFLLALPILMIVKLVITILYVNFWNPEIMTTDTGYHYYFIIFFSILGLVLATAIAMQKDPFARYFGIGAILATTCTLLGGLWSEEIINPGFDPYTFGILIQIVAYSFGIAFRQQQLRKKAAEDQLSFERSQAEMQRIRDLDEVKTRFFANISHEFRTPLSLILGPLQQAKPGEPGKAVVLPARSHEMIKKNAIRLQSLVDQLLDLSRLESGNVHLQLKQGGIIAYLRALVYSFESMAERQNISLNTSFPHEMDQACYDRDKLEKIVSNLLSNAFKFTPPGGAVTVGVVFEEKHLVLSISDTGKGIDQEAVQHIFDRFYRVEGTEEKGSGIGLALVKELVDLHGGQISVNSHKGKGTTFKVRLPVSANILQGELDTDLSPGPKTSPDEIHTELPAVELGTPLNNELPLALVVEDNEDLRSYVAGILEGAYRVNLARDGLQGERMALEHIPDVIVSDVMMPGKDGYALCHSLKNNNKTSHIPIILLTAKAGQANKMEGLTQGADAYITKPFSADELLLRARNLVEARRKIWEQFKQLDSILVDDLELTSLDDKFLQQVFKVIRERLDDELLSVEDIARTVGFSRSQLHRKLKALTDKSTNQLIVEIRLNEARKMLENKVGSVSEIAYSVGYSNLSYFTKSFKEKFGLLPSKVG
ncbi:ATP-binding protein [Zeaxanthinibacter sp. PT1]|uniref:ATP-binding protein n=1 Tax=Zeaxanthinibacter TaxID=561554 RepID=UPI002349C806|nr:ATP-binding protein [Zeaxanthinibacter sp. PT1]MDC6350496.1 ATP-binding protein [Zeaxanthinibacter sp. PT1]